MSERYYQDYNIDGWPIIDREYKQDMSRKCLVDSLNKYEAEIYQLRTELEQERGRVKLALKAMRDVQCDLKERSVKIGGDAIIQLGHGNWCQLCDAIDALSAGEGDI